jgi:hypothetical protein
LRRERRIKQSTLFASGASKHAVTLHAGLRTMHDLGPEVRRAISGNLGDEENFNKMFTAEEEEPMHRRNNSLFGRDDIIPYKTYQTTATTALYPNTQSYLQIDPNYSQQTVPFIPSNYIINSSNINNNDNYITGDMQTSSFSNFNNPYMVSNDKTSLK